MMDLKKMISDISSADAIKYAPVIEPAMKMFQINTSNRQRAFLAQMAHETLNFSRVVENLNYSAAGLLKTWPTRFTKDTAEKYAHHSEAIANHVYANRMGNGNEASGDGWKFRGRTGIMITGKDAYVAASKALGKDFVKYPDLLATPEFCMKAAAWWWKSQGLNEMADRLGGKNDTVAFNTISLKVNGGKIGLKERLGLYDHIKEFLA